jgi:hypothetical protein
MVGEAAQPWPGDGAAEVEDTPDRWVPPVGDRRERERGGPQERGKWAGLVWWAGWREQKKEGLGQRREKEKVKKEAGRRWVGLKKGGREEERVWFFYFENTQTQTKTCNHK